MCLKIRNLVGQKITNKQQEKQGGYLDESGGLVCLDSLKHFLSDKLLCLMPLPAS
jgi:hypothetical protein